MEHSIAAYLARLPKAKAEQLWQLWVVNGEIPPHVSADLLEILKLRLNQQEEQKSP